MSWDAAFDGGWWNYTHNTNDMIAEAYALATGEATPPTGGVLGKAIGPAWWRRLDGATGAEGAAYLRQIIAGLERDPERFRAMNPENGWGSYDSLLETLRAMLRASEAACCDVRRWDVTG